MKKIWVISLTILIIIAALFMWAFFPPFTGEGSVDGVAHFSEVPVEFTHHHDGPTFPFVGAAVIDSNNDGTYELFVGGGLGQDDALLTYQDGSFVNIIEGTGLSDTAATHGTVSLDINKDGQVDMIIARSDGLALYTNNEGVFTKQDIPVQLEEDAIILSAAPADINNDGFVDLYLSTMPEPPKFKSLTFNDAEHGKANVLLLNNGDNTFTDITKESGTYIDENTFLSAFVDLDHDNLLDLVVSSNTDTIHLFKNIDGTHFEEAPAPTGHGAWMGLALADYDNDGDTDLFFSNMARFVPKFLLATDLTDDQELDTDWALIENTGDFTFKNINTQKGLINKEFSWGATFTDLNVDGRLDLIVAENYIKWWAHKIRKAPGRVYVQNEEGNLQSVTKQSGLENYHFGSSPIRWDFDQDGREDVVWINMNGPVRALRNDGVENNYLKVRVLDSLDAIGARITVEKSDGTSTSRQVVAGTGFMTDQSPELVFGLGDNADFVTVTTQWINGTTSIQESVPANSVLSLN
jgi:hypothetical protein